jgi:glycosyltransferase involved in cell wall biosynthesis
MKLFEYMAAARPIVATRLSGLREVLEHERHGLLVEPGDAHQLRGAIERVLGDPALAHRLAQAAGHASLNYTWEKRANAMLARLDSN